MSLPRVVAEPLGGGALARRAIDGDVPPGWYVARPRSPDEWRARAEDVRQSSASGWFDSLVPAFGNASVDRLSRVAQAGGIVVTTGQQPGLFGGPVYTLSKALSALELADAIERATGIPAAPVFWAATDDADFVEAASVWVPRSGGACRLTMGRAPTDGIPMADVPLGDVEQATEGLIAACGSATDPGILEAVRRSYRAEETVGGAFVALLRRLLGPLGIPVLDASHPALLACARPLLARALTAAEAIAAALATRAGELRAAGLQPQVADVDGLSLVFARVRDGTGAGERKLRVPLSESRGVAARATDERLSPNVLLRPVVERHLLPTVAYMAGPGELSYFAQSSAVAAALGLAAPLAAPRWSCTIIEPSVDDVLRRYGATAEALSTPHALEGQLARAALPAGVLEQLQELRADLRARGEALRHLLTSNGLPVDPRAIDGAVRSMAWRVDRLERRVVAGAKRREAELLAQVATARGMLYPNGVRQERRLSFIPFLARYGTGLLDEMRASARRHADALVLGTASPTASPPA